jgi:hypothetical protein
VHHNIYPSSPTQLFLYCSAAGFHLIQFETVTTSPFSHASASIFITISAFFPLCARWLPSFIMAFNSYNATYNDDAMDIEVTGPKVTVREVTPSE